MDLTSWLEYFVEGLRSQMSEIQKKGEQLIKQDARFHDLKKKGINGRQQKAIKYLFRNGKITANEYQQLLSCIRRTAQRDLDDLGKKGIIRAVAKSLTDPTKHYVLL